MHEGYRSISGSNQYQRTKEPCEPDTATHHQRQTLRAIVKVQNEPARLLAVGSDGGAMQ